MRCRACRKSSSRKWTDIPRNLAQAISWKASASRSVSNLDINTIRWLEDFLDTSQSTMVIISHDRHFLNRVCTHMADLDYGKLQLFPDTCDEYLRSQGLVEKTRAA